jgi:hypothetical protein
MLERRSEIALKQLEGENHDVSLTRTTTLVDADCLLSPATRSTVFSKRTHPAVDNRRLMFACPQSGQIADVLVRPLSAPIGDIRNPIPPSETAFSICSAEGHDPAQHLQQPARQTAWD